MACGGSAAVWQRGERNSGQRLASQMRALVRLLLSPAAAALLHSNQLRDTKRLAAVQSHGGLVRHEQTLAAMQIPAHSAEAKRLWRGSHLVWRPQPLICALFLSSSPVPAALCCVPLLRCSAVRCSASPVLFPARTFPRLSRSRAGCWRRRRSSAWRSSRAFRARALQTA